MPQLVIEYQCAALVRTFIYCLPLLPLTTTAAAGFLCILLRLL